MSENPDPEDRPATLDESPGEPAAALTEPSPEPAPEPAPPLTETPPAAAASADGRARLLGSAALWLALMALLGGAGLGVLGWQALQLNSEQDRRDSQALGHLAERIDTQHSQLSTLRPTLESQEDKLAASQAELQSLRAAMGESRQRLETTADAVSQLAAKIGAGTREWRLTEIEQLLLIANDQAQLGGNGPAAIAALEIADQRIGMLADPELFAVRQKIAAELTALRAVPRPDIASLVLSLSGLAETTRRLTLIGGETPRFTPRRLERDTAVDEQPLNRFLAAMREMFLALFTLHRDADTHEPLMPPEQKYFLYQNLRLQFEAARLAVLQRDETSLRATLRTAEAWLQQYFDTSKPSVQAALSTIAELQGSTLNPALPDISGSLKALRAVLAAS